MKIKAGYRLTVVSWENDGDNYKTISVDGLTEEFVQFAVDVLGLLKGKFGNMYEPSTNEIEKFRKAVEVVLDNHPKMRDEEDWNFDNIQDLICEYTDPSEYYYTRVVEGMSVEYIPEEITLEDVSHKFGLKKCA
jgi:hypothetical protein